MSNVKSPFTGGATRVVAVTDTVTFREQQFTIVGQSYECMDTGEQFTDTLQDEAFVQEMRRQWRAHNGVPTAAQLTARRKALRLSGEEMATLLGLGINQYRQYEKGAFPAESKARLLQLAVDDRTLAALLDAARPVLEARTIGKLQQYLDRQLVGQIHWHTGGPRAELAPLTGQQLRGFVERQLPDGGRAGTLGVRPSGNAGQWVSQPVFA